MEREDFTFYITTLGCPKNQADSRQMHRSLMREGYRPVNEPDQASYHLINSCTFIEPAREETINTVLEAANLKERNPGQKVVLAGCFAQSYEDQIEFDLPEVDFSFGTGLYQKAGSLIADRFGRPAGAAELAENFRMDSTAASTFVSGSGQINRPYAPVKISDGCNRRCSFCSIPTFRGQFASRSIEDVVRECHELIVEEGVQEICLVSQDTNSFAGNPVELVDLLERIQDLGIPWIRLLYLYPDGKTLKILEELEKRPVPALVPYFESPVQHVSQRILRSMKRSGDYQTFMDLFARARSVLRDCEIRTTFLLGFPGEEAEDVDLLMEFVNDARPEKLALFSYSAEEKTAAWPMKRDFDEQEVLDRLNCVRNEHMKVFKEIQAARLGRVYSCMVDEIGNEAIARRAQDAPEIDEVVRIPAKGRCTGEILDVEIVDFFEYDLSGHVVEGSVV